MPVRLKLAASLLLSAFLTITHVYIPIGRSLAQNTSDEQAALARAFDAIDALVAALPRETFDPSALVATLDETTPAALLDLVRQLTRHVPYPGMLRGSRGILMDGTGNAADRALLLGELLRVTGHDVRLVRGKLDAVTAEALYGHTEGQVTARSHLDAFARRLHDAIGRAAAATGEDLAALEAMMTSGIDRFEGLGIRARSAAARQSDALIGALGPGTGDADANPTAWTDAVLDHWWIQVRNEETVWIDLDPAAQGTAPIAQVEETIDVDPQRPIELSVPEALFHRLSIRVMLEQWSEGVASERVALEATIVPALAVEAPITVQFVPGDWPQDSNIHESEDPTAAFAALVAAATEWSARLTVGDRTTTGLAFNDQGYLVEGSPSEGGGDLFGGVFGGVTQSLEQAPGGTLSAVWVEYRLTAPERREVAVRRAIFDLVGAAARAAGTAAEPRVGDGEKDRRALALSDRITILPQASWLSPDLLVTLQTREIAARRNSYESLLARDPGAAPGDGDTAGGASPAAHMLAFARGIWGGGERDVFLDGLNVLTVHDRLARNETGIVVGERAFDIVWNRVAVRPDMGSRPREVRIAQGVTDTIAEALLIGGSNPASNAAIAFSMSAGEQVPWTVIRSARDVERSMLDDATLARIAGAIRTGHVAVAPTRPLGGGDDASWWRVDTETFTTLGIGRLGWGADTSEYTITLPTLPAGPVAEGYAEYLIIASLIFACSDNALVGWMGHLGEQASIAIQPGNDGAHSFWARQADFCARRSRAREETPGPVADLDDVPPLTGE